MTEIVLVTHGNFGQSLLDTARTIVGEEAEARVIGVDVSRPMDDILEELRKAVDSTDSSHGVLVLTDMFGGTPTNISLSLLGSGKLEVVTGVNLPMVIKALTARNELFEDLAAEVKSAGKQGILVAGEVLKRPVKGKGKEADHDVGQD
ncbi:MAG: PTS sugar transporter subunit IIA [Desulfonatronovibrionaceae bacterium]